MRAFLPFLLVLCVFAPAVRADLPRLPQTSPLRPGEGARLTLTLADVKRVFPLRESEWNEERFSKHLSYEKDLLTVDGALENQTGPKQEVNSSSRSYSKMENAKGGFKSWSDYVASAQKGGADWSKQVHLGQECAVHYTESNLDAQIRVGTRVLSVQMIGFKFTGPQQVVTMLGPWVKRSLSSEPTP